MEIIKNVYVDENYFTSDQLNFIKNQILSIMNFFDIKEINKPTYIKIFNDRNQFKKEIFSISKLDELPDWSVGMAINERKYDKNYILELSLEEQKKIKYHKDKTMDDFIKTIVHEFVHICHTEYTNYNYPEDTWISEGIATYLSNQYSDANYTKEFEEIFSENVVPYENYRKVFNYIFENYSKEDILKLLNNDNYIKEKIINSLLNRKVK